MWCWGAGGYGQLGNGTIGDSPVPGPVTGLPPAVSVSAGPAPDAYDPAHSCAVDTSARVWCWGSDDYGQLGNGSTTSSSTPVAVAGLPSLALSVGTNDGAACATLLGGQVDCWGDNAFGELGNGSVGVPPSSTTPIPVSGFTAGGPVMLGLGESACALNTSQKAYCWGDNGSGELGDGTSGAATSSGTPVAVLGL